MVIGRGAAGPVVKRFSPQGLLLISAIFAAVGLFLLSTLTGYYIFFAAIIFAMGVCYFWPTMLGFISENIPQSGALGLNLMGGAGTFAVSVYTLFMGSHYDKLLMEKLPENADLNAYVRAAPGSDMANTLLLAKNTAGPSILQSTLIIPLILIVAFAGLVIYKRTNKKQVVMAV